MPETNNIDRDLLISINVKLERAMKDINELNDRLANNLEKLEGKKLERTNFDSYREQTEEFYIDHEQRIRGLERYRWILAGGIVLASFLSQFIHVSDGFFSNKDEAFRPLMSYMASGSYDPYK